MNWGALGERYIHGLGSSAPPAHHLPFHHFWLRGRQQGCATELGDYALNTAAPRAARFMRARPDMPGSPLAELAHAFHFDASRYAAFLRRYAEGRGVVRLEGRVSQVTRAPRVALPPSSWRMATASTATSSSTARASAACSSSRPCKPALRTGATGCL